MRAKSTIGGLGEDPHKLLNIYHEFEWASSIGAERIHEEVDYYSGQWEYSNKFLETTMKFTCQ